MKQLLLSVFILLCTAGFSQVKTTTVKKVLSLKMPTPGEDGMPGKRGASIVWHPVLKKYYAAMAGNSAYPLGVFDAAGKLLSDIDAATMQDVRGLWYNPTTKRVEANGYNDIGYFYYTLNTKGLLTGYEAIKEGANQPTDQSVGAYNPKKNEVLFYEAGKVLSYSATDASTNDTEYPIYFGRTAKDGIDLNADLTITPSGYNTTTLIYTGVAKAEIGFLNTDKKQIELYNMNNGFMTQIIKLPKDASTDDSFNFAYTNGMYWLFNMTSRNWVGYK